MPGDQGTAYIAGPVSGMPDGNRAAFAKAAADLESIGWTVINPTTNPDNGSALEEAGILRGGYARGPAYREIMRTCFQQVLEADCVFVLPGWGYSHGATREVFLARTAGIPVVDYATRRNLDPEMTLSVSLPI
jgi:hypothetical protein